MRAIFKEIQDHLPFDLMLPLAAAISIDSRRAQVRAAQDREALWQATQSVVASINSHQFQTHDLTTNSSITRAEYLHQWTRDHEEDVKIIAEVDQIRLDAIQAIEEAL